MLTKYCLFNDGLLVTKIGLYFFAQPIFFADRSLKVSVVDITIVRPNFYSFLVLLKLSDLRSLILLCSNEAKDVKS